MRQPNRYRCTTGNFFGGTMGVLLALLVFSFILIALPIFICMGGCAGCVALVGISGEHAAQLEREQREREAQNDPPPVPVKTQEEIAAAEAAQAAEAEAKAKAEAETKANAAKEAEKVASKEADAIIRKLIDDSKGDTQRALAVANVTDLFIQKKKDEGVVAAVEWLRAETVGLTREELLRKYGDQ